MKSVICPMSGPASERSNVINDMVNAIMEQGRMLERERVLARLRYGVKEFRSMAETDNKWELVAEILKEEADCIEEGDYWNG